MKSLLLVLLMLAGTLNAFGQYDAHKSRELCKKTPKFYGEDLFSKGCVELAKNHNLPPSLIKECLKSPELTNACLAAAGKNKTTRFQIRECRQIARGTDSFAVIKCIEFAGKKRLTTEDLYDCIDSFEHQNDQLECIRKL